MQIIGANVLGGINNTYTNLITTLNAHVYFHDVNGDGLADYIILWTGVNEPSRISVWLNTDGVKFEPVLNKFGNPFIELGNVQFVDGRLTFADMNGNGTDDIVLLGANGLPFIDFGIVDAPTEYVPGSSRQTRQGLLCYIENGLGVTTAIQYNTTAYLDALASGGWGTPGPDRWVNHSPRVENVVTKIQTANNLPGPYNWGKTVSYSYKDAIYDDWQQAFLGFRSVRVTTAGQSPGTPDTITETTYYFDHCQPPGPGNCPETSDDDDFKAVTGVPIVSETFDSAGVLYSTTVTKYQTSILFAGYPGSKDPRRVRFAYPVQTDTWLYDPTAPASAAQPVPLVVVSGLSDAASQSTATFNVPLGSATGRVHIRSEQQKDSWGNTTHTVRHGHIQDNGNPIDEPIIADVQPVTPSHHWFWHPGTIAISPFKAQNGIAGAPRALSFQYDNYGNLSDIYAQLTGTLPLERFHENPAKSVAPAPTNASVDNPNLQLGHFVYDNYGSLTQAQAPDNGCQSTIYDALFSQLPVTSTVFSGGCAVDPISIMFRYDRGLGAVTSSTASTGAETNRAYDEFGRLTAIVAPDPSTGKPSGNASLKLDYLVTTNGPIQYVHAQTADPTSPTSYQDSWTYLDGFGNAILKLRTGDGGDWIASGLALRDGKGSVIKSFRPWFYTGLPQQHPISIPSVLQYSFAYDGLARPTQISNSTQQLLGRFYHALSRDDWDAENLVAGGPHANMFSSVQQDGHGRTVAVTRQMKAQNGIDRITKHWAFLATGEVAAQLQTHNPGAQQVLRTLQYDSLGRLVQNIEPNTSTKIKSSIKAWRYAYDDAGHLVGTSDARGCGKNLFYDGAGRLVAEDYSPCGSYHGDYTLPDLTDGSGTETFIRYDVPEPGQTQDFGPNAAFLNGKVVARSDLGTHTRLAWDGRGRLIGVARQIAKPVPDASLSTRYAPWWFRFANTYDDADRIVEQTTGADVNELMVKEISSGPASFSSSISPIYGARGIVSKIGSSYGDLITSVQYDADGKLLDQKFGDAAATDAHFDYYDDTRNLKEFKISRQAPSLWTNSSGTGGYTPPANASQSTLQTVLQDLLFDKYDGVNNPLSVTDQRLVNEWPQGAKPSSLQLAYDDLYRLQSAVYQNGADEQGSPFVRGDASPMPGRTLSTRAQQQTFGYDFQIGRAHV